MKEPSDVSYTKIEAVKSLVSSGDIIFRNGIDEVSKAARRMNRKDTTYSHCGILFFEHDSLFVYHALGGSYNPSQKLLRESIENFCNPHENDQFGIYRYGLTTAEQNLLSTTVRSYYAQELKFDLYFNYFSDEKMYCSEFVFKSLNKSLEGSLAGYLRLDTVPFGVTTDDIFLHPRSLLVKREKFFQ